MMNDLVEDVIRIEATGLARLHKIADTQRVINIMRKTAIDFDGCRLDEMAGRKDPLDHGLAFIPSLDDALRFLPADKAMALFEERSAEELTVKTAVMRYWADTATPFYTHRELCELIKRFTEYLHHNRSTLISIGYPAKSFRCSQWLFNKLARLYPAKIPDSVQGRDLIHQITAEADGQAERDSEGNLIYRYTWIKERIEPLVPYDSWTECTYEEAPLIRGLSGGDVEHVEDLRARILRLKIKLLQVVAGYLSSETAADYCDGFWGECERVLTETLSSQVVRELQRIDKAYSDLYFFPCAANGSGFLVMNPVTGFQKDLEPGGLNSLFDFLLFVEQELFIGTMDRTKTRMLELTDACIPLSYYQVALLPQVERIDATISRFLADRPKQEQIAEMFRQRLADAIQAKFKCALLVSPEIYDAAEAVAGLLEKDYQINIDAARRLISTRLPEPSLGAPENTFRLDGDFWDVRFMGESTRLRDLHGPRYIHYLLEHKNVDVDAFELWMQIEEHCKNRPTPLDDQIDKGDLIRGLLTEQGVEKGVPLSDQRAVRACRKTWRELKDELKEARRIGKPEHGKDIEREIRLIEKYLAQVVGLHGRTRQTPNPCDRIRVAITNSINRALEHIDPNRCAKTQRHFSTFISKGQVFRYSPDSDVDWTLQTH